MAIIELKILKEQLKNKQSILGLDLGSKTIGVSISDGLLIIASPLKTIKRKKFSIDAECLKEIIGKLDIGALIIGLPISMDGREGRRCQSTRQFSLNILKMIEIPITFWDERLSTSAVERFLISQVDMSRRKRGKIIDKMAATYILQGALDFLNKDK